MKKGFLKKAMFLIPLLVVLSIIFVPIILNNDGILIFYGDSLEQMLHFYIGGWEKVHSGTLGLWNFSNAYGASTFCDVYYYLTSPFFWLCCLFPKAWIPQMFLYLNALKLALAYIFSYIWIKNIFKKNHMAIIGALACTFSGWVCFLFHYNFFLDTYFIYFILLYFVDQYLFENKKPVGISVAAAFLCIINYYNAYMFLPFMVIYAVMRWLIVKKIEVKKLISDILKLIGWILLGVGMSCFVLIPCAQLVLKTPRLQEGTTELFSPVYWRVLYRYITSLFSPVLHRYDPDIFIKYESGNGLGWGGGGSLYSSIFVSMLMVMIPLIKDKKKRNILLGMICLFAVMLTFPIFYKLLQGTIETRWLFMIILFNIYAALSVLEEIETGNINRNWIIAALFCVCAGMLVFIFFSYKKQMVEDIHFLITAVIAIFIILVLYMMSLLCKKKAFLICIAVLEAAIPMSMMFKNDGYLRLSDLRVEVHDADYLYDYIKSFDNGFYRIGISNRLYAFYENYSMMNNINGTTVYSSLYNYYQEDFLSRFKSGWKVNLNIGRTKTDNLMGIKYWITDKPDDIIPFGLSEMEPMGDYRIFINKYYVNLGFASANTLNAETFKKLSYINQDRLYPFCIITEDSENAEFEYKDSLYEIADEWTGHIEIDINNSEKGTMLYIENYDFTEVYITLYLNEEVVSSQRMVQYNYISCYYPSDIQFDKVVIDIPAIYEPYPNFHVYAETDFDYIDDWYENLNTFYDVEYGKDQIVAKIDVPEDSAVMTSVPYDPGWRVKVDGKQTEVKIVDLGFVGFEVEAGSHVVELTYWPSTLTLGIIVSVFSGIILVYLNYKRKKK